jgi:hypothetical protein
VFLCKEVGWIGNLYKEHGLDCKKVWLFWIGKIGSRTRSQFVQNFWAICKNLWNLLDLQINFLLQIPWTGFITRGPGLRRGFTGPPWTGSRRERRAHRRSTGRPVPRESLHYEWGERGRRPSGSSPEADGGGAKTVAPRRRRVEVAVRGAQWEGSTGADGASRCEGWDHGVETVL